MDDKQLKYIIEAALLAAGRPLNLDRLQGLFGDDDPPERQEIRAAIKELQSDYEGRGIAVKEVASGFRIQVESSMSHWLEKLWEERPPRYSRALLETLAIIAYRQPATRGEIEDIRGVTVTTNIVRTLLERGWIRVVGHRDVPGKPAMFGTTKEFLDYFDLKKLDDLPPLSELQDIDKMNIQLDLPDDWPDQEASQSAVDEIDYSDDEDFADQDNVASIEDARAATSAPTTAVADEISATDTGTDVDKPSATVVPLKTR